MTSTLTHEGLTFELPTELQAHEPPYARGLARDEVRLMVSRPFEEPTDHHAYDLAGVLRPGDLLVINTSGTLPAAVDALRPPAACPDASTGDPVELHFSTPLPAGLHLLEVRRPARPASLPMKDDLAGETLALPGGASAHLLARYPESERLWVAAVDLGGRPVPAYLGRHGRPIRYAHVAQDWPIEAYQTVYASEPGSAEMPSAGRPISHALVTRLVARGIGVSPIVLHAGVSSLEDHELPPPEPFRVPPETARRVNATRSAGGRVVAVGTTVVRALESAADAHGQAHPAHGWADVIVTPDRGVRVVDGLLTGWHEPRASHLLILEAIAGRSMLEDAYRAALDRGYLWHEFGDWHLLLPR